MSPNRSILQSLGILRLEAVKARGGMDSLFNVLVRSYKSVELNHEEPLSYLDENELGNGK